MALVAGRTHIEIKKTGTACTVAENPKAKLMYYFNCVCNCVEPDSDANIRRLRDYHNYWSLSNEEEAQLLILCLALSPDKLVDSIFFHNEDIDRDNQFYEVSAVNTKLIIAESLLIGGQQRRVQSIMMFKKRWIENSYVDPLMTYKRGNTLALPSTSSQPPPRSEPAPLSQPAPRDPPPPRKQQRSKGSCCTIL